MCLVSLCMIVRNEAKLLGRCLDSVAGFVDEIVVVDTGSMDATEEIAQRYGARIFRRKWDGDFSRARNFSLQQARGKWIFYLDADEYLPDGSGSLLSEKLKSTAAAGVVLPIHSFTETSNRSSILKNFSLRLWRHRDDYYFQGAIHEQIAPVIKKHNPDVQFEVINVPIFHDGYIPGRIKEKEKMERNLDILLAEYRQQPDDTFINYNLGVAYFEQGNQSKAKAHFATGYNKINKNAGYAPTLVRNYVICLIESKEWEPALEVVGQGIKDYPAYTDLIYLKGFIYKEIGRYDQSVEVLQQCLKQGESPEGYTSTYGVGGYRAYNMLAKVCELTHDYPQAINGYIRAIQVEPNFTSAFYPLLKLLVKMEKDSVTAEQRLLDYFDFPSYQSAALVADAWFQAGEYQLSLKWTRKAIDKGGKESQLTLLKGKCLVRMGKVKQALNELAVLHAGELSEESLAESCICCWLWGDNGQAQQLLDQWEQASTNGMLAVYSLTQQVITGAPPKRVPKELLPGIYALIQKVLSIKGDALLPRVLQLLDAAPNERPALRLAKLLWHYNHQDLAAEELINCMEKDRLDAQGYLLLAEICAGRQLFEEAEQLYHKVLVTDATYLQAYLGLAKMYLDQAREISEEAVRTYPDNQLLKRYFEVVEQARKEVAVYD